MTNSRVFVVEWENSKGTGGGSFPMFIADALATADEVMAEADAFIKAQGWAGTAISIMEYVPAMPKSLKLFRTLSEFDGAQHSYHMEIVNEHTSRGTGKWVVLKSELALEIHPNWPIFIDLPGGLS